MGKSPLLECVGFDWNDWNEWNLGKIWELHQVTPEEAEEVFFHDPFVLKGETAHSSNEKRYGVLGQSSKGRLLFVAFTVRAKLIRVVSARDMNLRESREYGRNDKNNS